MSRLLISFSATKCVNVYMYACPENAVSAKHNGSSILIDSFEASMNGMCRYVQQREDNIAVGDCTIKEGEPKAQSGNQWSNPVRNSDINKPSHGPSNKPFQKEVRFSVIRIDLVFFFPMLVMLWMLRFLRRDVHLWISGISESMSSFRQREMLMICVVVWLQTLRFVVVFFGCSNFSNVVTMQKWNRLKQKDKPLLAYLQIRISRCGNCATLYKIVWLLFTLGAQSFLFSWLHQVSWYPSKCCCGLCNLIDKYLFCFLG